MTSQPVQHSARRVSKHRPAPLNQLLAPFAPQPRRSMPGIRKKQYRFSVRADIDLLRLVVQQNPYGAAHGGRLPKWQAIADTLHDAGIDIDFRRARDRTALLLDQWRVKDLIPGRITGNQEDQAEREHLLEQIASIEQAAKPRGNMAEWRRPPSDPSAPRLLSHSSGSPSQPSPRSQPPPQPPPPPPPQPLQPTRSSSRHGSNPHSHAPLRHESPSTHHPQSSHTQSLRQPSMPSISDNADDAPMNAIASASISKYGSSTVPTSYSGVGSAGGGSHQSHLPPLVQNPDSVSLQTRNRDGELHNMAFETGSGEMGGSLGTSGHPSEKLRKTNEGKRLSPRFSQPLFVSPPVHTHTRTAAVGSASELRSGMTQARDNELGLYRGDVAGFRPRHPLRSSRDTMVSLGSYAMDGSGSGSGTIGAAPPTTGYVGVVNERIAGSIQSPCFPENQNIQLDALAPSAPRLNSESEIGQLCAHIVKLERFFEEEVRLSKKRLELEERRLSFERDRERKRHQLEQDRIDKQFEDRKEEREDRRRREDRDNEERERLLKIILRHQDASLGGGDEHPPD